MNIVIGADFVPTTSNEKLFIKGDAQYLLGNELIKILNDSDYRIFNLEIPLVDKKSPIKKCGPNLIACADSINLYKKINVNLFTIANNHIYDQGLIGLESTLNILQTNHINYVGGGKSLKDAEKAFIFECDGVKVGVYACAEHEFSIATDKKAGANPFDPLESYDYINRIKESCEYLIILYHGGREHYRYPSPNLQRYCRKFIDKGADLVICQHSHCIGAKEDYHKGTIIYGQGNFLFDYDDSECWKNGMLIKVELKKSIDGLKSVINYIPVVKNRETVRVATESEKNIIISNFFERSKNVTNIKLLDRKYEELADEMLDNYLENFSGKFCKGILYRGINKLSKHYFGKWCLAHKYRKEELLAIQNYIECEAHRELLINGIKRRILTEIQSGEEIM